MGFKLGQIIQGIKSNMIELKGTRTSVDALNTIMIFLRKKYGAKNYYGKKNYHYFRGYSQNGEIVVDKTQRAISHLYGIFYRTIRLVESGILPVYCFDGKPDRMKRLVTKDEINDFRKTKERYEKALKSGDKEKAKQIALGKEFLWKNAINETKELLNCMGIPYIIAPSEGEAQCAQLVKSGICDYVASTDFDVLLYGAKKSLRIDGFKAGKITGTIYDLEYVLNSLGLTRFQLIDLSILVGNDYFQGIKSIGLKNGIKLLKKYVSLENIIANSRNDSDYEEPGEYKLNTLIRNSIDNSKIQNIRRQFILPEVISNIPPLSLKFPKRGGIQNLMCKDHNLDPNRVEKGINRLIRAYNKLQKIQNHVKV